MLKKDNVLKFLFFSVILVVEIFGNLQTNLVISLFVGVFIFKKERLIIPKYFFVIVGILVSIFIIGLIGFLFTFDNYFTFLKDIIFFIKPIAFIILGFYFISNIKDKKYIFNLVILLAILLSIYHISLVSYFVGTTGGFNIISVRNYSGKSNIIEMLAILILINNNSNLFLNRIFKSFKYLILPLIIVSFILYFSRNTLVAILIMALATNGYLRLTLKRMKVFFLIIIVLTLSYCTLFLFDLKRDADGLEGFFYKLKIAPTELLTDDKIDKDTSHDILWDKWRGYESKLAISQTKNNFFSLLFGNGFGSLVDLKFEAPLGEDGMRYIPIIHSGYLFVFFKTGLLGLLCYIFFILYIINFANYKFEDKESFFVINTIAALGSYYLFSSVTITGIYNIEDSFTLFLGAFLGLYYFYKKKGSLEKMAVSSGE